MTRFGRPIVLQLIVLFRTREMSAGITRVEDRSRLTWVWRTDRRTDGSQSVTTSYSEGVVRCGVVGAGLLRDGSERRRVHVHQVHRPGVPHQRWTAGDVDRHGRVPAAHATRSRRRSTLRHPSTALHLPVRHVCRPASLRDFVAYVTGSRPRRISHTGAGFQGFPESWVYRLADQNC